MFVKPLNSTHILEHEKLASQAFVFPFDPSKAAELPAKIMLGAFTDDKHLAADMEIYDRICFSGDTVLSCAAVGGVASKPEYRNQGAIRAMMNALFDGSIYGDRWDISILYPFSTAYYYKFGYTAVGTKTEIRVPFSEFSSIERNNNVKLYTGKNGEELLEVYNAAAKHNMLAFKRDDLTEWQNEPYSTNIYTYLWMDETGENRAYATFRPDRDNNEVLVKEIAFLDKKALLGILGFLRCFEGNFSDIVFECEPANTPIFNFITDRSKIAVKYSHAGAVKILNIESVLRKHKYPVEKGSFVIEVKDFGKYLVNYENTTADVTLTEEKADIILGIAEASKLLLEGVKDERALSFIPGVDITGDISGFIKAFPFTDIFFNDAF